jgi:hypothetical protein
MSTKLSIAIEVDKVKMTDDDIIQIESEIVRRVAAMVRSGDTSEKAEIGGIKLHINHSKHRNGDSKHSEWGGGADGPIIVSGG